MSIRDFTSIDDDYVFDYLDDDAIENQSEKYYSFNPKAFQIQRILNYSEYLSKFELKRKKTEVKDIEPYSDAYYKLIESIGLLLQKYRSGEKSVDNNFTAEDFYLLDSNFEELAIETKEIKKYKNKKRH